MSGAENRRKRRQLERSQRQFTLRIAGFWRRQGINVTQIYSCIRMKSTCKGIKEEFLPGEIGNVDEHRLYNTLQNKIGSRVYIVQRGLDGITDKASLVSWLRY